MPNYNNILEEIFTSIHLIVDKKIADLKLDKSVFVTIISHPNILKNYYVVSYEGAEYDAYSVKSDIFNIGEEVLMLVPNNNFSNKKILLSRSSRIEEDII